MAENLISAEGLARAEAELTELRDNRRPAIVAAIKAAREEGDLSENAEYHAAREEQGMNEARIRSLEEQIANAVVSEGTTGEKAGVGSTVSFRDEGSGKVTNATLVHPLEAAPAEGRVSVESPVGKALLGGAKGAKVTFETPGGTKQLEILEVG